MLTVARTLITVRATSKPQKPKKSKVKAKDIKGAIDQAKLLCFNFEDTVECRLAWEQVEELSSAYNDQWVGELKRRKSEAEAEIDAARRSALKNREYDL